jgi:arsenate reductase-like glutaredoxin family protein
MANPRNQIHIVKRSKKEAIDNLKKNNISQVLIDILEDFMDRVIIKQILMKSIERNLT